MRREINKGGLPQLYEVMLETAKPEIKCALEVASQPPMYFELGRGWRGTVAIGQSCVPRCLFVFVDIITIRQTINKHQCCHPGPTQPHGILL